MGKTYKAVEITKPGTFRLVEKPVVGPGEKQVRIRVEACGVCHSDAGTVEGSYPGSCILACRATKQLVASKRLGGASQPGRLASASVSDSLVAKREPARPAAVATRHIARTP